MTILLQNEYVTVNCGHENGGCGVEFAMTRDYYNVTKRTGRTWYCPNGHGRAWTGKTDSEKLADSQAREVALRDQVDAAVREAERVRGALLRDRQRFANGVCPCCNRSFENVRRHMENKHPDYDVTKVHAERSVKFGCECGRSFDSLRGLRIHQGSQRSVGWESGTSVWSRHLTKV